MNDKELTRIQNGIDILKDYYESNKEDIYYEILKNISDTCKYKKSLLKFDKIDCISEGKPIFDNPDIKKLLLLKVTDKKILEKYFKDEYTDIIPFITNEGFIEELINSGLNTVNECSMDTKKIGGKSKKMRSKKTKRSKKRSKKR